VLEEMPKGLGCDVNAMSQPCCVVAANGEAMAGSLRVTVVPGRSSGAAWLSAAVRVCTHARGSWLPRAAAWSSRAQGTGIPGPRHNTAAEGDGDCGVRCGAMGPCTKSGTVAGWGEGVLRLGQRRFVGSPWLTPAARDRGRRWRCSPVKLAGEVLGTVIG
jgi:hypothetical protein